MCIPNKMKKVVTKYCHELIISTTGKVIKTQSPLPAFSASTNNSSAVPIVPMLWAVDKIHPGPLAASSGPRAMGNMKEFCLQQEPEYMVGGALRLLCFYLLRN